MPTKEPKTRKKPTKKALVMPSLEAVEEARKLSKSSPEVAVPGIVYGLDTKEWAHYVVDSQVNLGRLAAMRAKLLSKGYLELEDGPHSVSGYPLGAFVFVKKQIDARVSHQERVEIDRSRRR